MSDSARRACSSAVALGFGSKCGFGSAAALALTLVCVLPFANAARADEITIVDPSGANYAMHVTSLKEARFKRTIKQQYDFSCGSAAVATLAESGVRIATFSLGQPSLDEVFLALTGHAAEEATSPRIQEEQGS